VIGDFGLDVDCCPSMMETLS